MGIEGAVGKTESALVTWGVPLAAVIGGALVGDAFGLVNMLTSFVSQLNAKVAGVFVAAGLAIGGVYIARRWDGIIGKAVGYFLVGMALGIVYNALTGKQFVLPGMG